MAHFNYTARSKTGERASGSVKALNKAAAIKEVERMGLFPVTVDQVKEAGADAGSTGVRAQTSSAPAAAPPEHLPAKSSPVYNVLKQIVGTIVVIFVVSVVSVIMKSCSHPSDSKETESSPKKPTTLEQQSAPGTSRRAAPIYRDKINGYFTAIPPSGWKEQDYPSETVRSKVAFHHPRLNGVNVSIIAGPTPKSSYTLNDLLTETREKIETVLKPQFPGSSFTVSKEKVGDREAVVQENVIRGGPQKNVSFVNKGVAFSVCLNASSKQEYESTADTFQKFLNSFTILESDRKFSDTELKAAVIARYKRLAELYEQYGDIAQALAFVEEGLQVDPSNKELWDIQTKLTRKSK